MIGGRISIVQGARVAKRARAELRPYAIADDPVDGCDTYVRGDVGSFARGASRYWTYGGVVRTVHRPTGAKHGQYLKSLISWREENETAIRDAIEEMRESAGVSMPSGYADAFRARFTGPRVSWSHQVHLAEWFRGAWQAALRPGVHLGRWRLYDMQSAYLWAATQGLPDPASYYQTRSTAHKAHALYLVRLAGVAHGAPYPYDTETTVLATGAEIRDYGLDVDEIICGIAWRRAYPVRRIMDAIECWSPQLAKRVARCYWGGWASGARVECVTRSNRWELPPLGRNVAWAHLIVSRVRQRLADVARGAAHVFVDSVLTQSEIATGAALGDWRLVRTYEKGIRVGGPGAYGPAAGPLDKHAGVARNSPVRQRTA